MGKMESDETTHKINQECFQCRIKPVSMQVI